MGEPLSSVDVSSDERFAAIGCSSHVKVIDLQIPKMHESFNLQLNASGRFSVTDVAFSSTDKGILAASATNGTISVFDFNDLLKPSMHGFGKCIWDSGETPRSINKVHWHPSQQNTVISSSMDGTLKLYDFRLKDTVLQIYNPRAEASRDVQFNPFDPFIFAALSENGTLSIWDQRQIDSPVVKISAHLLSGLTLAWNPSKRGLIATGSRDKTVKVWDIYNNPVYSAYNSVSSQANSNHHETENPARGILTSSADKDKDSALHSEVYKPLHLIHTPSAVGRIRWRNGEKFHNQLATASLTSENQGGEILIWNINIPNFPVCVMKGHSETCTDFRWLDTPLASTKNTSELNQQAGGKKAGSKGSKDSKEKEREDNKPKFLGVQHHILSVGKDGNMLVQDIRNAYFPRQHVSGNVTAISSQGHVAFQRGKVLRNDLMGLISNKNTLSAPGFFADDPSSFGMKIPDSFSSTLDNTAKIDSKKENKGSKVLVDQDEDVSIENDSNFETGKVFVGLANITDLEEARGIRDERGAEGGVFDPAVVSLLAKSYKVGNADVLGSAMEACKHNLTVTKQAGLQNRSALWVTVSTILFPYADKDTMSIEANITNKDLTSDPTTKVSPTLVASACAGNKKSSASIAMFPDTLPFGTEVLASLLQELLEGGDCQHFVVLCEVLKNTKLIDVVCEIGSISTLQRREVYLSYFDLLRKLKLFCCVNTFIKCSDEEYISKLSMHGVVMHTSCAKCEKELPENSNMPWCKKCNCCATICSLCHRPVKGLMHWCPVCGHGGHLSCTTLWFKDKRECPSGCGHQCF